MKTNHTPRKVSAESEIKFTGIELKAPTSYAAGMLGVKVALEHSFKEMGVARSFQALGKMNQKEGFDCPSCAWPDPENRSKLGEYCENGAKALAEEATTKRVDAAFFQKYSVEELSLWSDYEIGKSGRIEAPMFLAEGSSHYQPISWEKAFEIIAEELHQLNNPNEAIFYTSGRSSNEAAFLYGMFARAFGTNNLPDCSNMCHESSGVALGETLGIGKGSVKLEDFYEAEVVLILGQNPGTNHPRMLSALEKCKQNGGKIVSINPLEEAGLVRFKNPQSVGGVLTSGTAISDVHIPIKINEDVALLKLIMKKLAVLAEKDASVFDHSFIEKFTVGYTSFLSHLASFSEEELLVRCGVSEDVINQTVALLAKNKKIIVCWAMGLTQHKNGVENIKECVNLLLLKGSLGKPGAGTCPVRGHSNVQGDRSVGIMHFVNKDLNERIAEVFKFTPPSEEGYDTVRAMEAMHEGNAKVFVGLGGNFVSAASDTYYTAEAFQNCNLTVQISTKLNRSHLITGKKALILPTLGRSEHDKKDGELRFLTVENSMGKVHRTRGVLEPASDWLKSEPEIIGGIANAYFKGKHSVDWLGLSSNYSEIRKKMSEVLPSFKKVEENSKEGGFYLPNNVRELDFSHLPEGKAQFSNCELPEHELAEDEFLLMTIRSHDQFNTTVYGLNDRYRGVYNERRVVFMHPSDMKKIGVERLEKVNLISNYDGKRREALQFLVVPHKIPKGNLAAYFPETNVLVPYNHYADKSYTPISKSIKVTVEKSVV
ncbi:FdhF/YdeP family oxidoreductase [Galbibacter mesophilus]|uniref:FdhF/YdeP family oxidoreductase n=1 Tax=Galbibacter mesophilus TaxID=379069 RepID=UPI00191F1EB6|nr:FdhF/YdeP family oxidoreductase [Galbibacter mesophilus]MCM5662115.1 FdhF/YdeP family oxidoreductase [Galbibacter mesophilus]